MNDPCINTTICWSHIWIYWILRKYGFPKDIVHQILKTHSRLYFTTPIYNQFYAEPIYQGNKKNHKYWQPFNLNSFKNTRKHYYIDENKRLQGYIRDCYICH
jgi:hypothetical protein